MIDARKPIALFAARGQCEWLDRREAARVLRDMRRRRIVARIERSGPRRCYVLAVRVPASLTTSR